MDLFLTASAVLLASAVAAILSNRTSRLANLVGWGTAIVGSTLGLVSVRRVFMDGVVLDSRRPWDVPYGSFTLEIDRLSAFGLAAFLLVLVFLDRGKIGIYGWSQARSLRDVPIPANDVLPRIGRMSGGS